MKINKEKLMSYTNDELCQILKPIIAKISVKYDFANIDRVVFDSLVLDAIDDAKKEVQKVDVIVFDVIFSKCLTDLVKQKIVESFNDPKVFVKVIDTFINEKMKHTPAYKGALKELKQLFDFLEDLDFFPTPDSLIELLQTNTLLLGMVKAVVDVNINLIKNNQIEKVFDDGIGISLIETYCMINEIQIEEVEDESDDEFYKKLDSEGKSYEYTGDMVKAYLREISKPLLSREDEREVALRVLQGDQKARDLLVERNLKLVVSIAKKYIGRGLLFMDLIQEGNIGLLVAVDKFDVTRGFRFSTYATNWIRQSITRAIADKGRNIRVPVHLYEKIGKYRQIQQRLEIRLNREPTIEEVAGEMGITIGEATNLHKYQSDTVSMNTLIGDDEDTEMGDFIPDDGAGPEERVLDSTLLKHLLDLMDSCNLKPREKQVLNLRYGLDGSEPRTLEEVGKFFHVTRERVRQIEAKAIMKIRRSRHIKDFAVYMESPQEAIDNIDNFRTQYRKDGDFTKKYASNETSVTSDYEKVRKKEAARLATIPPKPVVEEMPVETVVLPPKPKPKPIQPVVKVPVKVVETPKQEESLLNKESESFRKLWNDIISDSDLSKMINSTLSDCGCEIHFYDIFIPDKLPVPLTDEELSLCITKGQNGDKKLRDKSIIHNIKLVLSIVSEKFKTVPHEKKILVSVGLVGLIKAVDTFDVNRKRKFTTYASTSIENEIRMYIRKESKVNIETMSESKDNIENVPLYNKIREHVNNLPVKEKEFMILFFGFDGGGIHTQKEIADIYGIPCNFVSKIIRRVLDKIKDELIKDGIIGEEVERIFISINKDVLGLEEGSTVSKVKEREVRPMAKKLQSLYDLFSMYTREQVDEMLTRLTPEEKELIRLRYGNDLDNPITDPSWNEEHNRKFYGNLLPRMKRILASIVGKKVTSRRKGSVKKDVEVKDASIEQPKEELEVFKLGGEQPKEDVQNVDLQVHDSRDDIKPTEDIISPIETVTPPQDRSDLTVKKSEEVVTTKEDCGVMLKLLRTANFDDMLSVLSPEEAVIVCLRLGYVRGRCFSTEEISNFLGIETEEVREVTKKALLVYREQINNFIDQAIGIVEDKSIVMKPVDGNK